jgi:aerobic carbon-monoxide dehydrogenase large subunit
VSAPIGEAVRRLEDKRLLTGGSRYVSDLIARSKALRVKILRSPLPHARILSFDAARARALQGVAHVLTSVDLANIRDLPCDWIAPGMEHVAHHPVLARDRVRYVGEPVAAVGAASVDVAEEALAAILVEYERLPAVADQEIAIEEGGPQLHDSVRNNVAFRYRRGGGDVARAFAEADVIVRRRLINNRVTAAPLEGRAVLSEFDSTTGQLTHHTSSQLPHIHARSLAECLGVSLHKVRLIAPDIGGGFGAKLGFYAEDVICALMSVRTGRPCAWAETRDESFVATTHGRDHVQHAELAAKRNGHITALRTRLIADIGAYALGMGPGVPAINAGLSVSGAYSILNVESEVIGVYTNRTPTGPYRGAGHPEATFLIERMVEELARTIGRDPADVRRMNLVSPSKMPHRTPTGWTLDSGDYGAALDAALALAGYATLRQQQVALRASGRYMGIGLAAFSEGAAAAPSMAMGAIGVRRAGHESARVVVHADGSATVFCGAQSTGQGHVTSLAQVAASVLGLSIDRIAVVEGDTHTVPFGTGTFNSRSTALGGSAVYIAARKVLDKARRIAAFKLQRRPRDLAYEGGVFRPVAHPGARGAIAHSTNRVAQRVIPIVFKHRSGFELPPMRRDADSVTLADVAREAHLAHDLPLGMAPGLDETHFFDPKEIPFAYGTHVAVVEVDVDAGHVALLRHVVVDDCGRIINPLLADGQVHGGAAQGIGQALMEGISYTDGGDPLVGSFSEYAMPHAGDLPAFETGHTEIASKANPLGVRGVGEGATIGATPAVVNAVLDALEPLGVTDIGLPMTPMNVWRAIQQARVNSTKVPVGETPVVAPTVGTK